MRIMTTKKATACVSLAVAGILALSACGSNSANDSSSSSSASSSSSSSRASSSTGSSSAVNNGGGTSGNSGSGANGGAGAEQNSGNGAVQGDGGTGLVPALMEAVLRQIRVLELTAVSLAAELNNRAPPERQRTKIPVLKGMCRLLKTDPGLQPNPTVRS